MFLLIAIVATLVIFVLMGWLGLTVAKESDKKPEGALLSNNQKRAIGWMVAVLIALLGAVIEFFVVLR